LATLGFERERVQAGVHMERVREKTLFTWNEEMRRGEEAAQRMLTTLKA
jgi:hypothetical protein